jgi:hypothetical protein
VAWLVVGFVYSCLLAFEAFILMGGGHGVYILAKLLLGYRGWEFYVRPFVFLFAAEARIRFFRWAGALMLFGECLWMGYVFLNDNEDRSYFARRSIQSWLIMALSIHLIVTALLWCRLLWASPLFFPGRLQSRGSSGKR